MIDPKQAQLVRAINSKVPDVHQRYVTAELKKLKLREKQKLEAMAEYQHRCQMTKEEKRREAIDRVAKNRADREGIPFEQSKREVTEMLRHAFEKQDAEEARKK